jgi:hypothetical protein
VRHIDTGCDIPATLHCAVTPFKRRTGAAAIARGC